MHRTVAAIVWVLGGYLGLQIVLNLIGNWLSTSGKGEIKQGLVFSFINHLFLLGAGGYFALQLGVVQIRSPDWAGVLIAAGAAPVVFALSVMFRQLGGKFFDRSGLINPQDAVYYLSEERPWWTAGVINGVVLKPLAEETFLRGLVFLGALSLEPFPGNATLQFLFAALLSAAIQNLFYPAKAWAMDTTVRAGALCTVVALSGNQLLPALAMNAIVSLLWGGFHTRVGVKNKLDQVIDAYEDDDSSDDSG